MSSHTVLLLLMSPEYLRVAHNVGNVNLVNLVRPKANYNGIDFYIWDHWWNVVYNDKISIALRKNIFISLLKSRIDMNKIFDTEVLLNLIYVPEFTKTLEFLKLYISKCWFL